MMRNEDWLHRCMCGVCNSVIWIDRNQRVDCICSASWVDKDGIFGGMAKNTTDQEMLEYIQKAMRKKLGNIEIEINLNKLSKSK